MSGHIIVHLLVADVPHESGITFSSLALKDVAESNEDLVYNSETKTLELYLDKGPYVLTQTVNTSYELQ